MSPTCSMPWLTFSARRTWVHTRNATLNRWHTATKHNRRPKPPPHRITRHRSLDSVAKDIASVRRQAAFHFCLDDTHRRRCINRCGRRGC